MSDSPAMNTEVTVDHPFAESTTATIERANRLMAIRSHPGFVDIVQIALDIAKEPNDTLLNYPGWDALQIAILKTRAQTAKEFKEELFKRIVVAINEGVVEARNLQSQLPTKSAVELIEEHDFVRRKALEVFSEMDNRVAGSY